MDPQLLQQIMFALGYTPEQQGQISADFLAGAANAATFNQLPRIAAAGAAALTDQSYEDALNQAFAGRQTIRERSPIAFGGGELIGGAVSPLDKLNKFGKLARIGSTAGQAALYQTGEQGANPADVQSAAMLGGGLSSFLELLPGLGRLSGKITEFAQEAGLGLRGAAMKKSMGKIKNKTTLGEGYDLVRDLIESGKGSKDAIAQAKKVASTATDRAASYQKVADDYIKQSVNKQDEIVAEVTANIFAPKGKLLELKKNVPPVEFEPGKAFQSKIKSLSGGNAKTSIATPEADRFAQAYEELLAPILNPIRQAKAAGATPAVSLEDLIARRRALSANYNQLAQSGKAEVYTAVVDDLNEAIRNNISKYEQAGIVKKGLADEFSKAGKEAQQLITFNNAIELSKAGKGELAKASDPTRAIVSGGPFSLAGYYAGLDPFAATALGTLAGQPTFLGAAGQAMSNVADATAPFRAISDPLLRSEIKTNLAIGEGQIPEAPVGTPSPQSGEFDAFLQSLDAIGTPATNTATGQPNAQFDAFLQSLDTDTSSPANGDLPSQQLGLKQDVSLSQPDRFGGLAQYYAALGQTESSLNPMAKNPNSSAKGLFQFVDDTAARVGVTDPFDINQQLAGVQKLTEGHRQQFGDDPYSLYAAHFLGQPTLQAWQSGQPLQPKQQQWVQDFTANALPRFAKQYQAVQQPDSQIYSNFMNLFS